MLPIMSNFIAEPLNGGILIALSEDYHRSGLVFIDGKKNIWKITISVGTSHTPSLNLLTPKT